MIISHNEIVVACLKAFEALGLPLGQREDVAEAVGWLALHGLPYEDQLSTALHNFNSKIVFATPISQNQNESIWDAQGGSAIYMFANLADYAAAQASAHDSHQLVLRNLADFGVMWPYLAKLHGRNLGFDLVWKKVSDANMLVTGLSGARLPDITWMLGESDDQTGEIRLVVSQQSVAERTESESRQIIRVDTRQELQEVAQKNFQDGITINPSLWEQLKQLGKGVLVEATEESEKRGAGGV